MPVDVARRRIVTGLVGLPLAGCVSTKTPASSQLASVNHVFAVLDAETAQAADRSVLLRELADFKTSHVEAGGGASWTGRYLLMRTTFVELFEAGPSGEQPSTAGSFGIAFGGDVAGVLDDFAARARQRGVALEELNRRRRTDDGEIDWFRAVAVPDESPSERPTVDAWTMEYAASYFTATRKRASLGPADEVSRLRYNDASYRGSSFRDLEHATFAIERARFDARLRPMLECAGFRLREHGDGIEAIGDDVSLSFRFAAGARLVELEIVLATDVPSTRSERIGHSVLHVGPGRSARWTFDP